MIFLLKLIQKPVFLWCVLIIVLVLLGKSLIQLKKDNQRLVWNQTQMNQDLKSIHLKNVLIAKESGVLLLRMSELKQSFPIILKEIQAMGIAKRKVIQYAQTATKNSLQFETKVTDSFTSSRQADNSFTVDSISYRVFHYNDNYYTVDGHSYLDKQWVNISSRDTLVQILYRQRKNKWLWVFSPFIYRQRIRCTNPNASIYYSQLIQLQK